MSKFGAKNNLSFAVENYGVQIKLRAVCFRGKYKNKTKTKFTPALDRTGFCLFKKSDILNFVEIKKFKDCVSVSNNLCLKYLCKQCVSSEDVISTVHIGYDCLRGYHEGKQERMLKQQCCTYIQLLNILLGRNYCTKLKDDCSRLEGRLRRACSEINKKLKGKTGASYRNLMHTELKLALEERGSCHYRKLADSEKERRGKI